MPWFLYTVTKIKSKTNFAKIDSLRREQLQFSFNRLQHPNSGSFNIHLYKGKELQEENEAGWVNK